jgi:hypothetical protein
LGVVVADIDLIQQGFDRILLRFNGFAQVFLFQLFEVKGNTKKNDPKEQSDNSPGKRGDEEMKSQTSQKAGKDEMVSQTTPHEGRRPVQADKIATHRPAIVDAFRMVHLGKAACKKLGQSLQLPDHIFALIRL